MSQFRHKWRIVLDNRPIDVITTARDLKAIELNLNDDGPIMSMSQIMLVIHNALLRTEVPDVPSDPDEFLDLVDDLDDLEPGAALVMDPTRTAPSGG